MEKKNNKDLFQFAEYSAEAAESIGYSEYSYWKSVFKNFLKKKPAVFMTFVFIALVAFSFIALTFAKYEFGSLVVSHELSFTAPNSEFWFGTDHLGRDYWCQVWGAAQTSIKLAFLVAIGEMSIAVVMGCIWGYVRKIDRFMTELCNIMSNIPSIIYMTLIALMIGQTFGIMVGALILFGWLGRARGIRNLVLMYRDREYNLASRCLGTPLLRIVFKNIFPYLISIILLNMALSIPATIGLETTLSYLGVGLGMDTPSLGILLRNARTSFLDYPHLLAFPALIVSIITITFYLVGNAFADSADPRNHV